MGKITDKHFIDWESTVFGYGYGTGEVYAIEALKKFFSALEKGRTYDYEMLERVLTPTVAWLMINILCHADILDYGTSPRFGWLSEKGEILGEYLKNKTEQELYELTNVDKEYVHCYPDTCNCKIDCKNPLFL